VNDRDIDKLLGDLTERVHRDVPAAADSSCFLGRPVEFAHEICNAVVLKWQEEALSAFVTRDLLSIATCNGAGKTGGFSPLAMLYALFVERGMVIYQTSTERQARSQILRELRRWIDRAAALECDVYQHGILLPSGAALIITTPGQMEAAAGFRDKRLSIFVDEASALDDELFEALMGNIISDGNRLVLLGNPLRMEGCFAKTHRPGSEWWRRTVTAEEVINDPNAALIKGIITKAGVDRLRHRFGEESAAFCSRVHSRFPSSPADALYSEALLEAAVERWHKRTLLTRPDPWYYIGMDWAASNDGDEIVVTFSRNGHVLELHTSQERDTIKTVAWIINLADRRGVARKMPALTQAPTWLPQGCPDIYNGQPGMFICGRQGGTDRLAEIGFNVLGFNAARRPPKEKDSLLYANMRAWLAATFREYLVQGWVALPPDPLLLEELRVYSALRTRAGKFSAWRRTTSSGFWDGGPTGWIPCSWHAAAERPTSTSPGSGVSRWHSDPIGLGHTKFSWSQSEVVRVIRLSSSQWEIVRKAVEEMSGTVNQVTNDLLGSFGPATTASTSLKRFEDQLTRLSADLGTPILSDQVLLAPHHAPMLRTVLQARRRFVAQDVERRRLNSSDSEIIAALDAKLQPFQEFLEEQWFIDAVPCRVPKLADFMTLQRLQEISKKQLVPDPVFEDKFYILYSPATLLTDLARYRDENGQRDLPVSVVFLDLDNFKPLNTKYGEPRIDADFLPVFMRMVERTVFGHGRAYKVGGDEIILLLPNATSVIAVALLNQLRARLAAATYSGISERPTASCGICVVDSESPLTDRETVDRAARAKKFAKESGKHCIASFSTPLCRENDLVLLDPDGSPQTAVELASIDAAS
jgi:diguanylate cyclase (GGDEF)-like protein